MTTIKKDRYRLSNIELDFVSLVPAGDDPLARVVIAKADSNLTENKSANNADSDSMLAEKPRTTEEEDMSDKFDVEALDPEVAAYIEDLEAEVEVLSAQVEDDEKVIAEKDEQISKMMPKSQEDAEEIQKSLLAKADPAVRDLIVKQQAEVAHLQTIAKQEREARLEREFLAKAEEMPAIPTDSKALAALLRAASEKLTEQENETLEKALRGSNEAISKSGLFAEIGKSAADTTISSSVEAAAEAIRKSNPGMTIEQATAQAYADNPDLFAQAMTQN